MNNHFLALIGLPNLTGAATWFPYPSIQCDKSGIQSDTKFSRGIRRFWCCAPEIHFTRLLDAAQNGIGLAPQLKGRALEGDEMVYLRDQDLDAEEGPTRKWPVERFRQNQSFTWLR